MARLALLVALALGTTAVLAQGPQFWSCASGQDHLKISSISWSPKVPKKGGSVTISATGSLDETISGGSLHYEVEFDGIKLASKTEDLCHLLSKANITCPVSPGTRSIVYSSPNIPSYAPSGNYTAKAVAKDGSGNEITCLQGWFVLS